MTEQNVQNVLKIYKHFGMTAGQALTSNNLLAVASNNRWSSKDIQSGLDLAISKGWIEKTPTGWLKLTQSGAEKL